MKLISGGQTGVDRAALDAALLLGFDCGGWCPKGRRAEDGRIPDRYPLQETESDDYAVRTEWNVRDSDATLIITHGKPTGGTAFTIAMCRKHKKPCRIIDLRHSRESGDLADQLDSIISGNDTILNIAGPRESNFPGIHKEALDILLDIFKKT